MLKSGRAGKCLPATNVYKLRNGDLDGWPRVACAAPPNDLRKLLTEYLFSRAAARASWVGALPTLSRQWQTGKFSKDNRSLPRGKTSLRPIERRPACRVSAWWGGHVLLPAYFSTMLLDYETLDRSWASNTVRCTGYHSRLSRVSREIERNWICSFIPP